MVVEVSNDFDLLLDDLSEDSILDCKETCYSTSSSLLDFSLNAHPERYSGDDFKDNAA